MPGTVIFDMDSLLENAGVKMIGQMIGGRQNLQVAAALGTKQLKKGAQKKNIPTPGGNRKGLPKGQNDGLWLPNTERPPWLNGKQQN